MAMAMAMDVDTPAEMGVGFLGNLILAEDPRYADLLTKLYNHNLIPYLRRLFTNLEKQDLEKVAAVSNNWETYTILTGSWHTMMTDLINTDKCYAQFSARDKWEKIFKSEQPTYPIYYELFQKAEDELKTVQNSWRTGEFNSCIVELGSHPKNMDFARCAHWSYEYMAIGLCTGGVDIYFYGKKTYCLRISEHPIQALICSGKYLITSSDDGHLVLWNMRSGLELKHIDLVRGIVNCFCHYENLLIMGSRTGEVYIFDWIPLTAKLTYITKFMAHTGEVVTVDYNDNHIVTGGEDMYINLYNIRTHEQTYLTREVQLHKVKYVHDIIFDCGERRMLNFWKKGKSNYWEIFGKCMDGCVLKIFEATHTHFMLCLRYGLMIHEMSAVLNTAQTFSNPFQKTVNCRSTIRSVRADELIACVISCDHVQFFRADSHNFYKLHTLR